MSPEPRFWIIIHPVFWCIGKGKSVTTVVVDYNPGAAKYRLNFSPIAYVSQFWVIWSYDLFTYLMARFVCILGLMGLRTVVSGQSRESPGMLFEAITTLFSDALHDRFAPSSFWLLADLYMDLHFAMYSASHNKCKHGNFRLSPSTLT